MTYCNKCGQKIIWDKQSGKWVPLGYDLKKPDYGKDHRNSCKLDQKYIEKRQAIIGSKKNDVPLQIDESTFV